MSTPVNPAQQQLNVPPRPPIPARRSRTRAWVTLIMLVAVLGVPGYFAYQNWGTEAEQSKPGDCVSVTGAKFSPRFEKLGCDSPNVTHLHAVLRPREGVTAPECILPVEL
jgi:hypothetical protein